MSAPFTSLGKQVLANGVHYADAADATAAEQIAEAMNRRWQPIEIAPRDNTYLLVAGRIWAGEISGVVENFRLEVGIAAYFDGRADFPGDWWQCDGGDAYATWCQPTHWMPLPAPPVTNKQGEA